MMTAPMTTKRCRKCGEEKPLDGFHKDSSKSDGLCVACKTCKNAAARKWAEDNRDRNREKSESWRRANMDRASASRASWKRRNRDKVNASRRRKRRECPEYAVESNMRSRLWHALHGRAKPASTMELVGCSAEKLCAWLEMHFAEGMTWENRSEWHIDHIRPIASFEDPADPACWHWSNLQPLWAEDNMRKGAKWTT